MTQRIARPVAGDTLTESGQVHVEPYNIVKIDFPVVGERHFSEGQTTTFDSGDGDKVYLSSSIKVNNFSWKKDGTQVGSITLFNSENNDAAALVLENRIAGNPIEIYQTYRTTVGNNTTPVLYIKGECSKSVIDPDKGEIKIDVVSEGVDTKYIPNRYFTPSEGFNHLPATGLSITFGNEIFIFERAR